MLDAEGNMTLYHRGPQSDPLGGDAPDKEIPVPGVIYRKALAKARILVHSQIYIPFVN